MKGKFNKLDQLPDGVVKKPQSVMKIEATVDATMQELRPMRPYSAMLKQMPSDLKPETQIVLHALFSCFDRQNKIEVGKFKDLVWGFQQGQVPEPLTIVGIKELAKKGYVKFVSPDYQSMEIGDDLIDEAWVQYTPKLMDLVYENKEKKPDEDVQ